jgi:sialate O-acetylesterase
MIKSQCFKKESEMSDLTFPGKYRVILTGILLLSCSAMAEVKPAAVFSDHMVLQRDRPVPIWGTADPGAQISVEFAGQRQCATVNDEGCWQLALNAMPANTNAYDLIISAGNVVKIRDVLVGDLWICAGGLHAANRLINLIPGREAAIAAAKAEPTVPLLRFFGTKINTSRNVLDDVEGRWVKADKANMPNLHADGYYIGRKRVAELGVPIGIINIAMAWPGQPIETWMSKKALKSIPAAAPILDYYASDAWKLRTVGTYEERVKAWMDYCQKLPLSPPPKPRKGEVEKALRQEPAAVWNGMVAPLNRLSVRGVVWDHGEDDASLQRAMQYGQLLPGMIASWRKAFNNPELPFVVIQLRPFFRAKPHGLDSRLSAELRDSQREAAKAANAELVVTIDLPKDPHHREVDPRVADTILGAVYGEKGITVNGPELAEARTEGGKVILRFNNTEGGLMAKGGSLKGFAIADSLFRWVWADAEIKGDTVVLSAPTVDKPEGVRYAYQDLPEQGATLCNKAGMPAASFRTDTHPAVSEPAIDPGCRRVSYNARVDVGIENPLLPRILIIGDSISGHYIGPVRDGMRARANVIGEASMTKGTWSSMGPKFYRADWAAKGDGLKKFLVERGPFAIVHFNNGIHNFFRAKPGDEVPYAEQLRTVVATIRAAGAIPIFANSTGTIGDNTIAKSPNYLTNCKAFNAAAEEVMHELKVPVTDIYGATQPRVKELISKDLIHFKKEADPIMAAAIITRLNEALDTLEQ